jgi:hypothetical protein
MSVVSTKAAWNDLPASAKTRTTWAILENEVVDVPYSYGGWTRSQCSDLAKAGVDGILLHDPNTDASEVDYQVRLLFGKRVIYLQMKQDVETKSYWSQTYVVPYRYPGDNLLEKNSSYIIQVPQPIVSPCPCAPVTELGLSPGASNPAVGEAIAQTLAREFNLPISQARAKAMLMWGTNLSGMADIRAMELRRKYCFRGLDIANYGGHPYDFIPW